MAVGILVRAIDSLRLAGTAPTSAGLALLDDISASDQRNTLGATNGVWSAGHVAGVIYSAYASGTAYTLTGSSAAIDFGTSDPAITIARPGTYLLLARIVIDDNVSEDFFATQFKIRRTNNTPADVAGSVTTINNNLAQEGGASQNEHIYSLAPVIYTTANSNDAIALFAHDTAGINTARITEACLVAIQLSTGTP